MRAFPAALLALALIPAAAAQPASDPQSEAHKQQIVLAWRQTVPAGQVVPIEYSLSNGLAKAGPVSAAGKGLLADDERGAFGFGSGAKRYTFFRRRAKTAFRQGERGDWRLLEHEAIQADPLLSQFVDPRELVELALSGPYRQIQAAIALHKGVRCRSYTMQLERDQARRLLDRFGFDGTLAEGEERRREQFDVTFVVELESPRLRQVNLSLKVEAVRESKIKKSDDGDDFSFDEAGGGTKEYRIVQPGGEGQAAGPLGDGGSERTVYRSYLMLLELDRAAPPDQHPLEVPDGAKQLVDWK